VAPVVDHQYVLLSRSLTSIELERESELKTQCLYPIRLKASLHETIWGGYRLGRDGWKRLAPGNATIGEAWETEVSTVVENGPYVGRTLGELVDEVRYPLAWYPGKNNIWLRFPLLAKFIDANSQLSVQVHPNDQYAAQHEGGKLGKTEFWYILAAEPNATIVHGFKAATSKEEVRQEIENVTLDHLLHEEPVQAGDVIFVPAGTVHAIGSGIVFYELQEYSDITTACTIMGVLPLLVNARELHIERSSM